MTELLSEKTKSADSGCTAKESDSSVSRALSMPELKSLKGSRFQPIRPLPRNALYVEGGASGEQGPGGVMMDAVIASNPISPSPGLSSPLSSML